MSFAHVLELDSQTELLDRLELLTNFGSNLIAINGPDGYGKSWLAQRYLELGASNKNQCLLLCHATQDDVQRRVLILSQLVSDALFNQQEPLLDSLERILEGEPCDIAIVIDDAHLLSETLVSELWTLVLEAHEKPNWTINVLLFTQSGRLESVLSRLSYGQELKPVELDIDMLSEVEARRFFESLVVRYVDDDAEKRVRDAFKKVDPIPGDIMALGEMKVEKRIIIRSIVGSPLNIALVVLVLLLLAAGGYWWMFNQPSPDDKAQQITGSIEQTAIPTLTEPTLSPSESNLTSVTDDLPNDGDLSDATDDSNSLPPTVTEEVASVGNDDTQQRVVIESDVVDALLEGKPEQANTDNIKALVEGAEPQAKTQSETNSSLIKVVKSSDAASEEVAKTETTSSKPIVKFSFSREELKALSPRAYTLQLAAMTSMEDVQAFLDEHQLNNKVRIYPTVRSGTEWYIVTYQDYPTIQMARDAVEKLPDSLKSVSPWAKSLGQVHREIDRVK
ncbi:SPOR domain-containing protein [Vibrio parahaemolyticus]|uniref:SPOR domain-containing protein n=1 Tax=Vibrio parahaemolyticus TaxID=670 RepID=UPI0011243F49|nr:AAA family ATPase [Vibrio parahaemolyticus]MBE3752492.1 AAA family ATPase [Vibrio parahaemolyticus]TOE72231.1 cell division protein DamX [Vibrio parahaemolyticus]TOK44083.1 cell division protein DamX [Vibrio parahaemolyticus]HCG6612222.1 AAA family ATPase [Vibrio parahaemolyticus]HCG8570271.1 AAA family ATPase [Vibrio parahaemolyticus]